MWALALHLGGSPAFAAEAVAPADPVDTAAFDNALRQAQIAEGVMFWSSVGGGVTMVMGAALLPQLTGPQVLVIGGAYGLAGAGIVGAIPWAAFAGRRAQLALGAMGLDAHPWMGTVAMSALAVCLSAATAGSALPVLGSSNPDAFDSGWVMGLIPSVGLASVSLYGAVGLSVTQIEGALRHAPGGPRTGSRTHQFMVRPVLNWIDDTPTFGLAGTW